MENQTAQNNKQNKEKEAMISLILGIISVVISGLGYIYIYGAYRWVDLILIVISLLIPLIGLTLSIIGFKSTKKIISLTGVVLNLFGLIGAIFFNIVILFWHP